MKSRIYLQFLASLAGFCAVSNVAAQEIPRDDSLYLDAPQSVDSETVEIAQLFPRPRPPAPGTCFRCIWNLAETFNSRMSCRDEGSPKLMLDCHSACMQENKPAQARLVTGLVEECLTLQLPATIRPLFQAALRLLRLAEAALGISAAPDVEAAATDESAAENAPKDSVTNFEEQPGS